MNLYHSIHYIFSVKQSSVITHLIRLITSERVTVLRHVGNSFNKTYSSIRVCIIQEGLDDATLEVTVQWCNGASLAREGRQRVTQYGEARGRSGGRLG